MFFLGSLVMVSAIHAHFALAGLELRVGRIEAVFAGEPARVPVEVHNPTRRPRSRWPWRRAATCSRKQHARRRCKNLAPAALETAELAMPTAAAWPCCALGRLALTTVYPLGFFRSWRYEPTDAACLVYPAPVGTHAAADGAGADRGRARRASGRGATTTRARAPTRPAKASGTSIGGRWRGASRLLVKQFSGAGSRRLWLEYQRCGRPRRRGSPLSQLAAGSSMPSGKVIAYGLRLPGFEAEPARGDTHYHRCLGALAMFEEPPSSPASDEHPC